MIPSPRSVALGAFAIVVLSLFSCSSLGPTADYNHRNSKGQRVGPWISFNESTRQTEVVNYRADVLQGPTSGYYADGRKSFDGQYKAGAKSGKWTTYAPSGEIGRVRVYENDSIVEVKQYNPSW